MSSTVWPYLDWQEWDDTATTLHMYMQVVGKTRTALTPIQNHWWNVPLYVTARGLSTSAIPVLKNELLDIEFDFVSHELIFRRSSGQKAQMELHPQSVAEFFDRYKAALEALGLNVKIEPKPVEVKDPIPFNRDTIHRSYDRDALAASGRC